MWHYRLALPYITRLARRKNIPFLGAQVHGTWLNLIPMKELERYSDGTFAPFIHEMQRQNEIAKAIHEELSEFWSRTSARPDAIPIGSNEIIREQITEVKANLRKAVADSFGSPVGSMLRSIMRGSTNWHNFCNNMYNEMKAESKKNQRLDDVP